MTIDEQTTVKPTGPIAVFDSGVEGEISTARVCARRRIIAFGRPMEAYEPVPEGALKEMGVTRITKMARIASSTVVGPGALPACANDTSTSFDPPADADVDADVIEIDGETVAALSWSRRIDAGREADPRSGLFGASTRY